MSFANPFFLYLLPILLPLLTVFLIWAGRRQRTALNKLGNPALVQRLTASVNWPGRRWQSLLWLAALAALLLAMARPQWGTETKEVKQHGIEVMVALDVSNSMLAQDIKPDRLSRAKMEIAELMNRLGGNEIGLVVFSGASFIQFPLTSDTNTALTFLDSARPEVISKPGTDVGDAIRTALRGFDAERPSQKVIILITDGEAHDTAVFDAAKEAADQGARLYTIGFGSTAGEPIPLRDAAGNVTGYKKDQNGQVVISKLDEATLQKIAEIGGGKYYHAGADGSELAAIAAELDALQKSSLSTRVETWSIERFQIFLWATLMALVAIELIPDRLRQKSSKRAAMGRALLSTGGEK